jgi:hypothetical protein
MQLALTPAPNRGGRVAAPLSEQIGNYRSTLQGPGGKVAGE